MSSLNDYLKSVSQSTGQELTQQLVNAETLETHLIRLFNFYNKDMNSRYNWPWLAKETVIQTIANYTTGTVSVTNGGNVVTGSDDVTWIAGMVGRFLKLDRDNEIYEILTISGNTITLKEKYIGADGSGLNYLIWNKYYNLSPDVSFPRGMNLSKWPYNTNKIAGNTIRQLFANPWLVGYPNFWTWEKINRTVTTYRTGTVSITKDTKTLTGSSTVWLDNVFPGTKITIGSNV